MDDPKYGEEAYRALERKFAEVLEQKDQALEQKDRIITELKLKNKKLIDEAVRRNWSFIDQIPHIQYNGHPGTSTASQTDTGVDAAFSIVNYESSFSIHDFLPPTIPALWDVAQRMGGNFRNEKAFANLVHALLMDIIDATPFFRAASHRVEDMPKTTVEGRIPDTIVLKKRDNVPFFVVEVKKPGIFEEPLHAKGMIYGQLFDYLSNVRNEYGVEKPYGMLTTFNEFQICWLDDSTPLRALKGTAVLKINVDHSTSLGAIGVIASALIDAFNSPISLPTDIDVITKSCKLFLPGNMAWSPIATVLNFTFPHGNTQKYYINGVFHQGIEGKAYHVFNEKGCQAVLKFIKKTRHNHRRFDHLKRIGWSANDSNHNSVESNDAEEEAMLRLEMFYWQKTNNVFLPRIITANTKKALFMPYIVPLTRKEKRRFLDQNSDIFKQISSIFDNCVNQGFHQTDAAWRHIGWYKYGISVPTIKIFDFGHVVVFNQNDIDKKTEAKNAMLQALYDELR